MLASTDNRGGHANFAGASSQATTGPHTPRLAVNALPTTRPGYAASRVSASSTSAALTTAGKRSGPSRATRTRPASAPTRRPPRAAARAAARARAESSSIGVTTQAPAAEADRAGAGGAELDPRPLEREQVLDRLRRRAEAVLQLLAQLLDVGDLAARPRSGGGGRSWPARSRRSRPGRRRRRRRRRAPAPSRASPRLAGSPGRGERLVEHLHVQLEAERGDVAGLLVAEQVAGAAHLEVAHRDLRSPAPSSVKSDSAASRCAASGVSAAAAS